VKSLLKNHRATLIVLVISLVALCIRIPSLDSRPFHGDEANQAYKTGRDLLENGKYIYDPHDHHGPTLYYLTLIPAWIAGQDTFVETQDWTYRIVPVVFGAGLILIMLLLRPAMSTPHNLRLARMRLPRFCVLQSVLYTGDASGLFHLCCHWLWISVLAQAYARICPGYRRFTQPYARDQRNRHHRLRFHGGGNCGIGLFL
jgi:hypothetical protein